MAQWKCDVCGSNAQLPAATTCAHALCAECLLALMRTSGDGLDTSCPICAKPFCLNQPLKWTLTSHTNEIYQLQKDLAAVRAEVSVLQKSHEDLWKGMEIVAQQMKNSEVNDDRLQHEMQRLTRGTWSSLSYKGRILLDCLSNECTGLLRRHPGWITNYKRLTYLLDGCYKAARCYLDAVSAYNSVLKARAGSSQYACGLGVVLLLVTLVVASWAGPKELRNCDGNLLRPIVLLYLSTIEIGVFSIIYQATTRTEHC